MTEYDNTNKGAIWIRWGGECTCDVGKVQYSGSIVQARPSDNPKAPKAAMYLVSDQGVGLTVALWKPRNEGSKAILTGPINFADGTGYQINVYKNQYKEKGDAKPDLNVQAIRHEEQPEPPMGQSQTPPPPRQSQPPAQAPPQRSYEPTGGYANDPTAPGGDSIPFAP